jgi:hypothetical protein
MFQNIKIGTITREKYSYYYDNNMDTNWNGHQLNLSSKVGKSQSFIITKIQFLVQLVVAKTIPCLSKDYH